MAYDIYGENLIRGHCEVHPYVHEEYPCSVCYSENEERQPAKNEQQGRYEDYCREEAMLREIGFQMC